ncbi:uncharacterized protein LOC141711448 isoform X1 [Apium graveolens]|uniref:uncharacterized protein LOC141711448 isoform X1 n=2 Tax=Apium graveolens TaxID=4045 RepID=UPI003D7A81A5
MATIISQLNLMGMCSKRYAKVLALPCTRQVNCSNRNFPKKSIFYTLMQQPNSVYHRTNCSLQEILYNCDGDVFGAQQFMMTKPSVCKNFVDRLSTILASLLTHGTFLSLVIMATFLYASNPALAVSSGRIGGSSSSSSSYSSSSGQSSVSYYWSDDDDCYYSNKNDSHTCTCDTSCTKCIVCEIRKNGYTQGKKEKGENNSSTNTCSCNCHSTCYFHKKYDHLSDYITLAYIVLVIVGQIYVETEKQSADDGTMLFLQVGVLDKKGILQRNLNNIAKNADTSTVYGLNRTLKEVVRALLQHDNSSLNFCRLILKYQCYLTRESLGKSFEEILSELLEGFDGNNITLGNVNGVKYEKQVKLDRSVGNEYTMATIMVLAAGHHRIPKKKENGKEYFDSFAVLQTLQRIPKDQIHSVEVFWSPQKENEVLTEEDIRRCTSMTRMEDGRIFVI